MSSSKTSLTLTPPSTQPPKVKKIVKIKKTKPKSVSPPLNEEIIVIDETIPQQETLHQNKTKEEEYEFINNLNELQKKAYNIAKCHLGSSFNLAKSNIHHFKK